MLLKSHSKLSTLKAGQVDDLLDMMADTILNVSHGNMHLLIFFKAK